MISKPFTLLEGLRIDHSSAVPLYHQIKENLRDLIESGELKPGMMLPSERELAERYAVSRLTVRQAISELARDGLLIRQHGIGTFVAPPKLSQAQPMALSFTQRMIQAGRTPASRVLACEIVPATRSVARRLQIEPETPVLRLSRLRLADGQPVMLETTHLPAERFPGLEHENFHAQSLYAVLSARYGIIIAEAEQSLEPVALSPYEAAQLGAPEGAPAMLVEVVAFSQEGWPVEYSRAIVRGDTSRYVFRLRNVQFVASAEPGS
ncbi:MAG: GntR family transcriptional regulator [Anaerolineae bacterium]|nr:GntR family transcriptional regulator [Anaerolineae bacterium]MDW8101140.1 GntR family transcriptional regulator [Anaerolineae bacterium]